MCSNRIARARRRGSLAFLTFSGFAAALVTAGSTQAQSNDEPLRLTESGCASAALAATIRPDRIGEPVSAVVGIAADRLMRFRRERTLGSGGMGIVSSGSSVQRRSRFLLRCSRASGR